MKAYRSLSNLAILLGDNSAPPASDYDGRAVKAVSPVKTCCTHWTGDTSPVGAGVGSNPTRNHIFQITFESA